MEHRLRFEVEATHYAVWRQGEWCFTASVVGVEGDVVDLRVDFAIPGLPALANTRGFTVTAGEGLCLEMECDSGAQDDVCVSLEAAEGPPVILRFDLPEGVELRRLKRDGDVPGSAAE